MSDEGAVMSPAEMREWVTASRAAQGLPPTVEDPAILDRVAALLDLADERLRGDHAGG